MAKIYHYIKMESAYRHIADDGQVMIVRPTGRYVVIQETGTPEYEFDIIEPYMGDESKISNRIWLQVPKVYELFDMSNGD